MRNGKISSRRRVVITGVGCVTPLGSEVEQFWRNLVGGQSAVGSISIFDASNFPVRIAAEVRDWDMSDVGENPADWRHHPRQTTFAVGSAIKAHQSAGLIDANLDPVRFGIYLGCGETYQDFGQFASMLQQGATRLRVFNPDAERELDLNMPAAHLAARFGTQGPTSNCVVACATSTQAVGESAEIIRRGDAEVMLAGGAHSMIHPFGMTGFHRLSALSQRNDEPARAARPFDRDRDGFVVSEGAATFVLEELEHAKRRGAEIWCELSGYGNTQDAHHVIDPHPEGRGAARCMAIALDDARLNPDDVSYINAHGTGTVANDRIETMAIKKVFDQHAYNIPISSTKSMVGHCTTGSGAVELVACIKSIQTGTLHPTINLETQDPECDLDYVPNTARDAQCQHVLKNNFGFGGQNVSLVLSRYAA